jgi:hypothetical protein
MPLVGSRASTTLMLKKACTTIVAHRGHAHGNLSEVLGRGQSCRAPAVTSSEVPQVPAKRKTKGNSIAEL